MKACLLVIVLLFVLGGCDIKEVEHIVIFMQENRAFDHYFGTLHGVRGFNDRTVVHLPSKRPVWFQQVNQSYFELPWHMDTVTTSGTCVNAPEMDYPVDIAMWNKGLFDSWNSARFAGMGMSYFRRQDLDFYYSLADAYTIGDNYHQSTFTQTNPNRLHLFSGSNGLSAGFPAVLDNEEPDPGWTWETFAETLEKAGVSWKVYQEADNFDDNGFEWFKSFQEATPGNPLYDQGRVIVPDIVEAFGQDLAKKTLPQVSWIIAPAKLSEHANNRPAYGEDLTARLLKKVQANSDMYSKMMFILNYDEQGGFFDHIPPPTPPADATEGLSTVTVKGEIQDGKPIGLGFRVPIILISPWTTGGYVCSEVFDHTSVIKFVEKRFGVRCPNISPWRRAVTGDLLSAINWNSPNYTWPTLPDTSNYVPKANKECTTLPPPTVPLTQSLPIQEKGTKKSRAIPYVFYIEGRVNSTKSFEIIFMNFGKAGAVFIVYDLLTPTNFPKRYTVEPGKSLRDLWVAAGPYELAVHGPNGFVRLFSGDTTKVSPGTGVSLHYRSLTPVAATLVFNNTGTQPCLFTVTANAYRKDGPWEIPVGPGQISKKDWLVGANGNWYDLSVKVNTSESFLQRFMGRVENGLESISDPAMAGEPLYNLNS